MWVPRDLSADNSSKNEGTRPKKAKTKTRKQFSDNWIIGVLPDLFVGAFHQHSRSPPSLTAHVAHMERVTAHARYSPTPRHFSIGKVGNTQDREFGNRH